MCTNSISLVRSGSARDPGPDPALIEFPSERRWRTQEETAAGYRADSAGNGSEGVQEGSRVPCRGRPSGGFECTENRDGEVRDG